MTLLDNILDSVIAGSAAEPAATLVKGLDVEHDIKTSGASEPITLADGNRVWLVPQGTLDLFFVENLTGARHHLMRVESGGIALESAFASQDGRFLLVPSNGAHLAEVSISQLIASRHASPESASALATALTDWVVAVAHIAARRDRPTTLYGVDSTKPGTIDQPSTVRSGAVWVASSAVEHAMWAEADAGAIPSGHHVPIAPGLWAVPTIEAGTEGLTIPAWLETPDVADDLAAYHARAVALMSAGMEQARAAEARRLSQVRNLRNNELSNALSDLASVMLPEEMEQGRIADGTSAAVAAQAVWSDMGLTRDLSDAALTRVDKSTDPVNALAREAGLFVRKVDLSEPDWWQSDHGALLGFRGDERAACALLPGDRGRYDRYDTETGQRIRVDKAEAANIAEDAFSFSEPLPREDLVPRTILRFAMRGVSKDAAAVIAMALLAGLLSLVTPIVTGWVMDPVIPDGELNLLWVFIGALIVAGMANVAFSLVQGLASIRMEGQMSNRVQTAVWDRLLRLPASFFRGFTVGDLANRAQGIDRMRSLLTGTVVTTLLHSVSGLFSLGYMFFISWRLAVVTMIAAAIYAIVIITIGRRVLSHNRESLTLTGQIQGITLQLLNAVSKLRIAGAESGAFARWSHPYSRLMAVTFEQQRLNNVIVVFKNMFHFITVAALIAIIGWQGGLLFSFFETPLTWAQIDAAALHTVLPTAAFVSFNVAFGQFLGAAFGISQQLVQLTNLKPLYERVEPIFEAEIEEDDGAEDPGEITGAIEMTDICFRYAPEAPLILNGLSLNIAPGSFVAIVGPSGAGKSTFVRLLLGFDQPESGSIFFDGKDLAHLDKTLLRRQLGVVLQNGRALAGSLFDNIAAGANVSRDDVMDAARLAGLEKDIEQLPMGLDTYLGEGASTLSGGQRQRMMIARAVVNKPKVLIFDEATSALDNETQALVSRGLEGLDASRIVIAHRLSTIVHADQILVLSGGVIAEKGTYDELMALDGIFAQLAKRQIV